MTWKSFIFGIGYAVASGAITYASANVGHVSGIDPVYSGLIGAAIGAIGHLLPSNTSLAPVVAKILTTSAQK